MSTIFVLALELDKYKKSLKVATYSRPNACSAKYNNDSSEIAVETGPSVVVSSAYFFVSMIDPTRL